MAISADKQTGAADAPLSRHAIRPPPAPPPESLDELNEEPTHPPIWNLPNGVTALRAAMVPVLLLLPLFPGETGSTVIAWIFIAAALSDLVDGWLARRGQMVTDFGKLIDPLADKLLVSTALIVLLAMDRIPSWGTWMVVTIVGRELAVTGLRGIASAGGQVVAAKGLGKLKTVIQNVAAGALIFHYPTLGIDANAFGLVLLTAATALTLASGYSYFADYFRSLTR